MNVKQVHSLDTHVTSKFYISRLIEQAFSQFCFQRENNKLEIVIFEFSDGQKWTVNETDQDREHTSPWIYDKAVDLTLREFALNFSCSQGSFSIRSDNLSLCLSVGWDLKIYSVYSRFIQTIRIQSV